ncbi:MAG: hypothetical protein LC797_08385 [Chloroflexi bacterium]|nr:hypothetical protein [Chloroflexota bacterium]
MAFQPKHGAWAAPLPDLSQPAIDHHIAIGARRFRIAISSVQRDVPREPDTHLVQIGIFQGELPLTPHDLGLQSADACANVWAYLTNRVNETVVQFYTPSPRSTGELNPRLRDTLVEAVSYWVLVAQRTAGPIDRRN